MLHVCARMCTLVCRMVYEVLLYMHNNVCVGCMCMYVCIDMFLYVVLKYQTCWRWCNIAARIEYIHRGIAQLEENTMLIHLDGLGYICVDTIAFWRPQMGNLGFFSLHGISINTISPFQYNLDCPHLNMTEMEKIRLIWTDIIKLDVKEHVLVPQCLLVKKVVHVTHISGRIYLLAFLYGYTCISCILYCDRAAQCLFTLVRTKSHRNSLGPSLTLILQVN